MLQLIAFALMIEMPPVPLRIQPVFISEFHCRDFGADRPALCTPW